jgi:hypothetical protein
VTDEPTLTLTLRNVPLEQAQLWDQDDTTPWRLRVEARIALEKYDAEKPYYTYCEGDHYGVRRTGNPNSAVVFSEKEHPTPAASAKAECDRLNEADSFPLTWREDK